MDSKIFKFGKGQGGLGKIGFAFLLVQKIASVSIMAMSLKEKYSTLFSLVSQVSLIVFPELVRSMSELASGIVRAESRVHEFFTQF